MNLKEYLFYSDMTVREFAKHAEIHDSYLCSIMSGGRKPSKRLLQSIEIYTGGWVKANEVCSPTKMPEGFPVNVIIPLPETKDEDTGNDDLIENMG